MKTFASRCYETYSFPDAEKVLALSSDPLVKCNTLRGPLLKIIAREGENPPVLKFGLLEPESMTDILDDILPKPYFDFYMKGRFSAEDIVTFGYFKERLFMIFINKDRDADFGWGIYNHILRGHPLPPISVDLSGDQIQEALPPAYFHLVLCEAGGKVLNPAEKCPADTLKHVFNWEQSRHGYSFWKQVYCHLVDNAAPLPLIKKTAYELLEIDLPEPYFKLAKANALDGGMQKDYVNSKEALGDLFNWGGTPEGHDFWDAVHEADTYEDLPKIPSKKTLRSILCKALPKHLFDRVRINAAAEHLSREIYEAPHECLEGAFLWDQTPEGTDFWSAIHTLLKYEGGINVWIQLKK